MVLTYSIAFDVDATRDATTPPTTAALWSTSVALLHESLRVRERLPTREEMLGLIGQATADLSGEDLDLRWAQVDGPGPDDPTWAMSIDHPGSADERLLWGIDLSARARSGGSPRIGVRLRMEALDSLRRPLDLEIRRPGIVQALLNCFRLSRDGLRLSPRFLPIRMHGRLRNLLTDPGRRLPVILLGPAAAEVDDRGFVRVVPHLHRLAREAGGAAVLAIAQDRADLSGFHAGLDRSLHLPADDQFAIYWPLEPGMTAVEIKDSCRELFAIPEPVRVTELVETVIRRLSECLVVEDPGRVAAVDTLRVQHAVSAARRRRRDSGDLAELIAEHDELLDAHDSLGRELRETKEEFEEARRELRRLRFQLFGERDARRGQTEAVAQCWSEWQVTTMAQAIAISTASPDLQRRVLFSDQALRGAKSDFTAPVRALEAIHFLGGAFFDHVRGGVTEDLVEFSRRHGFEVAMNETGSTRNNENWMKERDATVDGRTVRCIPHLKLKVGKAKDSPHLRLSIHFAIEGRGEDAMLVIGHVGRHLTTASSTRW